MLDTAPDGFNLEEFFDGVYLFQNWEIFPGISTEGPKPVTAHLDRLQFPARIDGLRVLDIAPWNGFFSFECVRRGAASVTSFGPDDPDKTGFNAVRELLQVEDKVKYIQASVYDLTPDVHGTFDIVLFLGLIYHLRHPLLALDRVWEVSEQRMFTDSPIIDTIVFDRTISEEQRKEILEAGTITNQLPMAYFTKGSETGDPYNWFMPNGKAFRAWVESAGFVIDNCVDDGGWASIACTKGERPFLPGLEGYNQMAATVRKRGS